MVNFWSHLGIALIMGLSLSYGCSDEDEAVTKDSQQKVEIKSVFINCEQNAKLKSPDEELVRFERQQQIKHNMLKECSKKLALTVRLVNDPRDATPSNDSKLADDSYSGEDFVPVDHVFEGSSRKRYRLLKPYLLRLSRDLPLQAYKLKKLGVVTAFLTDWVTKDKKNVEKNIRRDSNHTTVADHWPQEQSTTVTEELYLDLDEPMEPEDLDDPTSDLQTEGYKTMPVSKDYGNRKLCENNNQTWIRDKRHKQKYMPENYFRADHRHAQKKSRDNIHKRTGNSPAIYDSSMVDQLDEDYQNFVHKSLPLDNAKDKEPPKAKARKLKKILHVNNNATGPRQHDGSDVLTDFTLYEIGIPSIWHSVHMQVFEKQNTPGGKPVWKDFTNGEVASVNTTNTEWIGRDMTARYRPVEWMAREDFALPATSLCLMEPFQLRNNSIDNIEIDSITDNSLMKYIIAPMEDIVLLGDGDAFNFTKRDRNFSEYLQNNSSTDIEQRRRAEIRLSRALFGNHFGNQSERFGIAVKDNDRYLTMPHLKPHRSQIDLEVRADDNKLVKVGDAGSIVTIVADSSIEKRTVLTVQALNTGMASAKFRVTTKECGPLLADLINAKAGIASAAVVLHPLHPQTLTLELPVEVPADAIMCTLALENGEGKTVAIRNAAIRKADRCFCVWQCDCVCLTEDPKLLCRKMSRAQQLAAGLVPEELARSARSCKKVHHHIFTWDHLLAVMFILLMLGFLKAMVGVVSQRIGTWGIHALLRNPRTLERYYEKSLKERELIYDSEGWPIHPDTMKRDVQIVSKPIQFFLNLTFFVALPCIWIINFITQIYRCVRHCVKKADVKTSLEKLKSRFSSHDIQTMDMDTVYSRLRRKRRGEIRRWMTPEAEQLTGELWQTGLPTGHNNTVFNVATAEVDTLLSGSCRLDSMSEADSERDDTAYVLTQMQKSRESITRSQMKAPGAGTNATNAE